MRFPVLQGSELWALVKFVYITDTSATLPVVDSEGNDAMRRHSIVNAVPSLPQSAVYCEEFLKNGAFEAFRSVIIHIDPDPADPHGRLIINGGTLTDAILMACKKDPTNRHVLRLKAEGLTDTYKVDARAPMASLRYMKTKPTIIRLAVATASSRLLMLTLTWQTLPGTSTWTHTKSKAPSAHRKVPSPSTINGRRLSSASGNQKTTLFSSSGTLVAVAGRLYEHIHNLYLAPAAWVLWVPVCLHCEGTLVRRQRSLAALAGYRSASARAIDQ